eukprot:1791359-Prymnesium_polylepis.1
MYATGLLSLEREHEPVTPEPDVYGYADSDAMPFDSTHAKALSIRPPLQPESVLLREGEQRALRLEVGAFHRTGGGEGPAASTLVLVLDRRDGAGRYPVDRRRDRLVGVDDVRGPRVGRARRVVLREAELGREELVSRQVREHVVAERVRVAELRVVLADLVLVRSESGERLGLRLGGLVQLGELALPRHELRAVVLQWHRASSADRAMRVSFDSSPGQQWVSFDSSPRQQRSPRCRRRWRARHTPGRASP